MTVPDPDIVTALKLMPLFSELTDADIDHIAVHTRKRHLNKSEVLFQRGDPPRVKPGHERTLR